MLLLLLLIIFYLFVNLIGKYEQIATLSKNVFNYKTFFFKLKRVSLFRAIIEIMRFLQFY